MSKSILLVEGNGDDELLTIGALRTNDLTTHIVVARGGAEALRADSYVRNPFDIHEFTVSNRVLGLPWLVLNRTPGPTPAGDTQ